MVKLAFFGRRQARPYIEQVFDDPITQLELDLLIAVLDRKFDDAAYGAFVTRLEHIDQKGIAEARTMAQQAVAGANITPRIDTRARQLFWGAQMLNRRIRYIEDQILNVPSGVSVDPVQQPYWRNLLQQPIMVTELVRYAETLRHHADPGKTRIRWGAPMSWYYYDLKTQIVNNDPLHSLIFGLPKSIGDLAHSRFPGYHEVGHALLSKFFPAAFTSAYERIKELQEKENLSEIEKQEATDCSIDCMLWGQFFNLGEDNVANRFAKLLGQGNDGDNQNYGRSLIYTYALIKKSRSSLEQMNDTVWGRYTAKSRKFMGRITASSAMDQFQSITTIMGLSVPLNEGLMPNTKAGWEAAGLKWSAFLAGKTDQEKQAAINDIVARCDGGINSISHMQPLARPLGEQNQTQTQLGSEGHIEAGAYEEKRIAAFNIRRNEIMESLWKDYIAPIYPELKKAILQQHKKELEKAVDGNDGVPNPSSSSSKSQQAQPGQSKDSASQTSDQKKEKSNSDSEAGNEDADSSSAASGTQKANENSEQGADGKQQDGNKTDDDSADRGIESVADGKEEHAQDQGKNSKRKPVGPADIEHKPGDEEDSNSREPMSSGDQDIGQTLSEIIEAAEKSKQLQDEREQAKNESTSRQAQAGISNVDRHKFAEGNWSDYRQRCADLTWLTQAIKARLEAIRRKQMQTSRITTSARQTIAGSRQDFNMQSHRALVRKVAAGQVIQQPDVERFNTTQMTTSQATPTIIVLTDASGSMLERADKKPGVIPINIANSFMVALNEAVCELNREMVSGQTAFLFHAGVYGPHNPFWLAAPDMAEEDIGKNLHRYRQGLNCGTCLSPALRMLANAMGDKVKGQPAQMGATHLILISDGDVQDVEPTMKVLTELVKTVKNLTVDVVMMNESHTVLEQILDSLVREVSGFHYGIAKGYDADTLPANCLNLLEQRIGAGIVAVPEAEHRGHFTQAAQTIRTLAY